MLHNFLLRRTKLHCCQSVGYGGHSSTRLMIKKRFLIFYLHYFYFIGEKLCWFKGNRNSLLLYRPIDFLRKKPTWPPPRIMYYIFHESKKLLSLAMLLSFLSIHCCLFLEPSNTCMFCYRVNISRPTVCCCLASEPFPDIPRSRYYTDVVAMIFLVVSQRQLKGDEVWFGCTSSPLCVWVYILSLKIGVELAVYIYTVE